jgi:hypothetical protein
MPLRCIDPERGSLQAFDLHDQEWSALLVANKQRRHLRLPCCDAAVVMKTSRLGNRFFAHLSKGVCSTAPESEQHRRLKNLCVEAARRAGWQCETEVRGWSPSGEEWIADVLATRGEARIAIEVQLAAQTLEETVGRQERYRESGVRGLWLFRHSGFPISKAVPAVLVSEGLDAEFIANLPDGYDRPSSQYSPSQSIPLRDFLDAAFAGRFRYGIPDGTEATITLKTGLMDCYFCGVPARVIFDVEVSFGPHVCNLSLSDFDDREELLLEALKGVSELDRVGAIKRRFSRTRESEYLSNGCPTCDKLVGEFYLHNAVGNDEKCVSVPTQLSTSWCDLIASLEDNRFGWAVY